MCALCSLNDVKFAILITSGVGFPRCERQVAGRQEELGVCRLSQPFGRVARLACRSIALILPSPRQASRLRSARLAARPSPTAPLWALGLDSVAAIQITARCRVQGLGITVADVFAGETVMGICNVYDERVRSIGEGRRENDDREKVLVEDAVRKEAIGKLGVKEEQVEEVLPLLAVSPLHNMRISTLLTLSVCSGPRLPHCIMVGLRWNVLPARLHVQSQRRTRSHGDGTSLACIAAASYHPAHTQRVWYDLDSKLGSPKVSHRDET